MTTIRIVTNTDRCHCSVNNVPTITFIYSDYRDRTEESKKAHAINDAKVECFNELAKYDKGTAVIDTAIISK